MSIEPSNNYEIECVIDFPHPFINKQSFTFLLDNGSFGKQIASARTFGFTTEIEMLRKANLALGGSLDNAIVLTPDGMLNETPLRFDDEFVRHKILDIIGDFALIGMPLQAKITAEKSGHSIHASLMSKLLKAEHAWEIVDSDNYFASQTGNLQNSFLTDRFNARLLIPIRRVKSSLFVDSFIRMCTEEISLCLDQVCRQAFGAERIEVCECR